jgi:acetone carboxylase gamma subunit
MVTEQRREIFETDQATGEQWVEWRRCPKCGYEEEPHAVSPVERIE